MKLNNKILILCGGTGPRLWPLSRAFKPKQFIKIFDGQSFLATTWERAKKIEAEENIYLVSNKKFTKQIESDLDKSKVEGKIIEEPEKKNTAMAVLYAISQLKNADEETIVTVMPSDHFVGKLAIFKRQIKRAIKLAAELDSIVTIGLKPRSPNPGFGYILPESKIGREWFKVKSFIEKPDQKTALKLIKEAALWNSGMYIFKIKTILEEFAKYQPEYYKIYEKIIAEKNKKAVVDKMYKIAPTLAIDKAISEKSKRMICLKGEFDWSDVGEWRSIYDKLTAKKGGLALINSETEMNNFGSDNCLIGGFKGKLIGLVGVENLAVIDTPDALLICNLNNSYDVKNLIGKIVENKNQKEYFLGKDGK